MIRLPRFTKSVSVRLSMMVVGAIAFLLLASLGVMFYFSRKTVKEEALNYAVQTLDGTVRHIDNILLSVEQATGNMYFYVLPHLNEPQRLNDFCCKLVEANPYIVGCAIAMEPNYYPGKEYFMAYCHRSGNSPVTDKESELIRSDTFGNRPYTEQTWYKEAMEKGRTCWIDPLKEEDTEDEALTTFSIPFYNAQGKCIGVMASDVSIALLSKVVLDAKPSDNGYCTLLGRNGSYIVHPDTNKLFHQTVFTQTKNGADPSVLEAANAMVNGETGYKYFKLNGLDSYVFYKPYEQAVVPGRAMDKLGWSVGVIYPEDDIFGEYNQLFYDVLGIAIAGLLLLFVLCTFIIHHMLRPLNLLSNSAKRIAEGEYNENIPETHRRDELGRLQGNFRQMQQKLATHVNELEQVKATLNERGERLHETYRMAKEADRMKTAVLNNMTNRMIAPTNAIENDVYHLHHSFKKISQEEADDMTDSIQKHGEDITKLLNQLIADSESDTRKEEDAP